MGMYMSFLAVLGIHYPYRYICMHLCQLYAAPFLWLVVVNYIIGAMNVLISEISPVSSETLLILLIYHDLSDWITKHRMEVLSCVYLHKSWSGLSTKNEPLSHHWIANAAIVFFYFPEV